MFNSLQPVFNLCGVGNYRSVCLCLRYKSMFKPHDTINSAKYLVDTRGSGFNIKTASVIGLLFAGFHLSLMRPSDKHQKYSEESKMERTHQHFETIGEFSQVLEDHKESYVARVLKRTLERSLILLIKSATAKVSLALSSSGCQHSFETSHNASRIEDVDEQRKNEGITALDDLVRNAVARKELDKIIRIVGIGRGEKEIRDHPLFTVAESTAHYLMRQMDYVET
ncbi:unnamed protein product [Litomosoides sigmodontis]|uniref:Uncharacterized protein n=1 Tax=Litomosoides sigmodontis TaxID=42156 RepID=A0A3P6U2Z9_LITSI|nr:unnamed protein product [Litomosoides sigmodontis]